MNERKKEDDDDDDDNVHDGIKGEMVQFIYFSSHNVWCIFNAYLHSIPVFILALAENFETSLHGNGFCMLIRFPFAVRTVYDCMCECVRVCASSLHW